MIHENYLMKYYSLINNRLRHPLPENEYGENHHIFPKSLFPKYARQKKNIIRLSASEHLRSHYYLMMVAEELGDRKAYLTMLYTLMQMSGRLIVKGMSEYELKKAFEIYENAKTRFGAMMSEMHRGKPLTEEHKRRISQGMMGHPVSEETRRKMALAKLGKKRGPMKTRSDKGKKRGPRKTPVAVL